MPVSKKSAKRRAKEKKEHRKTLKWAQRKYASYKERLASVEIIETEVEAE